MANDEQGALLPPLPLVDFAEAQHFISLIEHGHQQLLPPLWQLVDDDSERKAANKLTKGKDPFAEQFPGQLDQVKKYLAQQNIQRVAIFMQINPGPKRGAKWVTAIRACFVDFDDNPPIKPVPLPPSIIVQSSQTAYKQHFYWKLVADEPLATWQAIQKRIALYLGGDLSIHNLDRPMRVPGFFHQKGASYRTRIIEAHPERVYTLAQIEAAFPLTPVVEKPNGAATPGAPTQYDALVAQLRWWLKQKTVKFFETIDSQGQPTFRITCPNDASHADARFYVDANGYARAGCFHNHCGGNQIDWFKEWSDKIGGWCPKGYFQLGDHNEVGMRLLFDLAPDGNIGADKRTLRRFINGLWREISVEEIYQTVRGYSGWRIGHQRYKVFEPTINGVIRYVKKIADKTPCDEAPVGVAFENGFVGADGQLVLLKPEHRQTFRLPLLYDDGIKSPVLGAFFDSCFAGDVDAQPKIALLQEFAGASLFGLAGYQQYNHELILLLQGGGRNGKGTYAELIKNLLPSDLICNVGPRDMEQPYWKAKLYGKRANIVWDLSEHELLNTGSFKSIISGEPISARNPFEEVIEFRPRATHIMLCNALPPVSDHSDGFWRRIAIVNWNRKFEDDPSYKAQVLTQKQAFAVWAVAGALRVIKSGFTKLISGEDEKQEWRTESDSVALWLEEETIRLDAAPQAKESSARWLYQCFRVYCQQSGRQVPSATTFGRRLRALSVPKASGKTGNFYALIVKPEGYKPLYDV